MVWLVMFTGLLNLGMVVEPNKPNEPNGLKEPNMMLRDLIAKSGIRLENLASRNILLKTTQRRKFVYQPNYEF